MKARLSGRHLGNLLILSFLLLGAAWAQTEQTLLTFTGTNGASPYTGLIEDSKGHFFGATSNGGANGTGVVYALVKNNNGQWKQKILYQFGVSASGDGADPVMDHLAIDSHGNLYGTTAGGGAYGGGTVFKLSPASPYWKETILYCFGINDAVGGSDPQGGVAVGPNGIVYGTTNSGGGGGYCGGGGCGVVFALRNKAGAWTQTVLHVFAGIPSGYQCNVAYDGENPYRMTPVLDSGGNIFGTTSQGGDGCGNKGTIWELSPAGGAKWNYTEIYVPIGFDPLANPDAGVSVDGQDNVYGTTGGGVIFELVKGQPYQEEILYQGDSNDGGDYDTVTLDTSGNLFWTSQSGFEGEGDKGAVHELSPDGQGGWTYSTIYKFPSNPPTDGTQPFAGVMIDASGNLYGTTVTGGTTGSCTQYPYCNGTVWEITP